MVSGYNDGGDARDPITSFAIRYRDRETWRDIPKARAEDNSAADWSARFEPVTTDAVRLVITRTPNNVARVWEVGLYDTAAD